MNEHAKTIQIVINTLQDLDIKSTFDNMNRLMGAMQTLAKLRDELNGQDQGPVLDLFTSDDNVMEETTDGNADTE